MRTFVAALLCLLVGCSAESPDPARPGGLSKSHIAEGSAAVQPLAPGDGPAEVKAAATATGGTARAVGDPCTTDGQCAGGKCLRISGQAQRYCTQSCASDACPEDATCYAFSVGRYCLKECKTSAQCHAWQVCDGDHTCWPGGKAIDGGHPGAELAEPCDTDGHCKGGVCLRDVAGTGYCTSPCAAGCGDDAICWNFSSGGSYCLKSCTGSAQCNPWMICDQDYTCWPGDNPVDESEDPPVEPDPVEPEPEVPEGSAIGESCGAAADCRDPGGYCYPESIDGTSTGFLDGYCLVNQCQPGTCPEGSVCKPIYVGGATACVARCAEHADCRDDEGYGCVAWNGDKVCWPRCSATGCPDGYACNGNTCVPAPTTPEAPPSTGNVCDSLPPKHCEGSASWCGELLPFEPDEGPGYVDYPLNGESWNHQYRSYARRDLIMLVKWAAAWVECHGKSWEGGNGHPLGLGDMSEANGAIPGTSDGDPGHPPGTHVNGRDMDIAYYQKTGPNNHLRPVCPHNWQNHCTGQPDNLDVWRSALFIGALLSSERTRVVGVDGKIGPLIENALDELADLGVLPPDDGGAQGNLAYETVNHGNGWYYFHHHHLHVSLWGWSGKPSFTPGVQCLTPECGQVEGAAKGVHGCVHDEPSAVPEPIALPPVRTL